MRRASALVMAIWLIAVLSIMVLSFATEAHIETGLNVFVRERNRANRLVEAGRVLGEIVLLGYDEVPERTIDGSDIPEALEDNRWYVEMQNLKTDGYCKIGGDYPILLDADDPDSGTVTIDLRSVNSCGENDEGEGPININNLSKAGGDSKYSERWWMIFRSHNIPEELNTKEEGTIKLWNRLISSWDDWRDEDDSISTMENEECGAENEWYEDYEEEHKISEENRRRPRQGPITDVGELAFVRGFREYPQILYGGVINPWERKEDQITVTGIIDLFCTDGSSKINVNNASKDVLITLPGVYKDAEDDDAMTDAEINAEAIIAGKKELPSYDVDEKLGEWPYKDWSDLTDRTQDADLGADLGNYLEYKPESKTAIFKMTIVGESMGLLHRATAKCYIKDKKIRYVEWSESSDEND